MKPIVYIILIILISLVMGAIALTAPHECEGQMTVVKVEE